MTAIPFWSFDDHVLVWSANVLIQLTLVFVASLAISAIWRRDGAVRHGILCCGLIVAMAIPLVAAGLQSLGIGLLLIDVSNPQSIAAIGVDAPINSATSMVETSLNAEASTGPSRVDAHEMPQVEPVETPSAAAAVRTPAQPSRTLTVAQRIRTWLPLVLAIWLLGAVVMLIRLAVAFSRMAAILHSARPNTNPDLATAFATLAGSRGIELVVSDRVSGPVAAGIWRPRVVLPSSLIGCLTPDQAQHILTHELTHIARCDQLVVLLQNLLGAFYWIHPLTSLFNRQLAQAREEVCDNHVLTTCDATSYSRTLLALTQLIQTPRLMPAAVGLFCSRWRLEDRVACLLDDRSSHSTGLTRQGRVLLVTASMLLAGIISAGTIRLAAGQPVRQNANQPPTKQAAANTEQGGKVMKGTITNDKGRPVSGAFVALMGMQLTNDGGSQQTLAEGVTDGNGHYALTHREVSPVSFRDPVVIARADGLALAWKPVELERPESTVDLTLQPQQLMKIRLIDSDGAPATNVSMTVTGMVATAASKPSRGSLWMPDPRPQPKAALATLTSDASGHVTIPGIPAGNGVFLKVQGTERFALQTLNLNTGRSEERPENDGSYRGLVKNFAVGEVGTVPLAPATPFAGVVLLGDTDQPAANTRLTIWSSEKGSSSMLVIEGKTDAQGRFRLIPNAGVKFGITAYPPEGSSCLARSMHDLTWTSDASQNIEIRLPAAVQVQGTIVDAVTGKPLVGASVQYHPERFNNKSIPKDFVDGWNAMKLSGDDGRFVIAVPPGPGTLLFHAPVGANYVLQERGQRQLDSGAAGGIRYYAHAFQKINPVVPGRAVGGLELDLSKLTIKLQPGGRVEAKLVDDKGQPIQNAIYTSRLRILPAAPFWRGFPDSAPDGRATITGLEPGKQYPVYFLEPRLKLGATAIISLDDPQPTVTLKPCATAKVRFLKADGKPVKPNTMYGFEMVVTPGICKHMLKSTELAADEDFVGNFDRVNHGRSTGTNSDGELLMPALIPGATYRFHQFAGYGTAVVEKEFIAESGKHHDLGDIVMRPEE